MAQFGQKATWRDRATEGRRRLQVERQLQILNLLTKDGVGQVSELSVRFGVSRNTIRRDLKHLEEQGLVSVRHGGAVSTGSPTVAVTFQKREDQFASEKRRLGERAAQLIEDGDAIIIDAGTTTERIIPALKGKRNITVITNGINIALGLSGLTGVTTVMSGGILDESAMCTAGFHAEEFITQFHVAKAFIGTGGITADGLTNTNAFEVPMKRAMIRTADLIVLVVTHDKVGRVSLTHFAALSDVDIMITGAGADRGTIAAAEAAGIEVVLCE